MPHAKSPRGRFGRVSARASVSVSQHSFSMNAIAVLDQRVGWTTREWVDAGTNEEHMITYLHELTHKLGPVGGAHRLLCGGASGGAMEE